MRVGIVAEQFHKSGPDGLFFVLVPRMLAEPPGTSLHLLPHALLRILAEQAVALFPGTCQLKQRVLLPPVFEFPASFRTLVKAQLVKGRFDGLAEVLSETGEVLGVGDGRANDDERTDDHRQLNGYAEPGKRGQVIDEVCQDWINGCSHFPLPNLLFDAGSSSSLTSATSERYMHSTVYSF